MDEEDLVREERALEHPVVENDNGTQSWTAAFIQARRERQLTFNFPWEEDSIFTPPKNKPNWFQ